MILKCYCSSLLLHSIKAQQKKLYLSPILQPYRHKQLQKIKEGGGINIEFYKNLITSNLTTKGINIVA